jgi:hypothetical protein
VGYGARARIGRQPLIQEADELAEFDMKKMTTNDWILGGGCIAVFIGVFLKWIGVGGGTESVAGFKVNIPEFSVNGFHYFFQGTIPWILAIAILAVLILRKFVPTVSLPDKVGNFTWNQVILAASALSGFLILTRLLMGDSGADRKIGLFLSSLGGIAMAVGAFLRYQAGEDDAPSASGPPTAF